MQGQPGARELTLLAAIAATGTAIAVAEPRFLTTANLSAIGAGMIYDLPLAAGMTLILIGGGIDLSVGAVLALTGVVMALALRAGVPTVAAVLAGLVLAATIGAFNGWLVARQRLPAFIATLGVMSVARGAAVLLTSGYMLSGLPPSFLSIGRGEFLGLPYPILLLGLVLAALQYLLVRWRPLVELYYVGQNPEAARHSGVPVVGLTWSTYVVGGLLAGVAAVFMTSRLGMGYARFAELAELRAIAAAVLGGATLTGGTGSIAGSVLGVVLLAVVLNGFVLLNLSVHWQGVATGLVLVGAMAVDAVRRRERTEH